MTAFPVDRKRRWNTAPRRRRCLFLSLRYSDSQIADSIEFNRLKSLIGNWQRITGRCVSGSEMVFRVSALPHPDEEFSGFRSHCAAYPQGVAQIAMAALIKRAAQSDTRLHRNQHTVPRDFLGFIGP